jgi:hypothetical protein
LGGWVARSIARKTWMTRVARGELRPFGRVGASACARRFGPKAFTRKAAFGRRDDRVAAARRFATLRLASACRELLHRPDSLRHQRPQ